MQQNSRPIAALVGPTLTAMLISEFPLVQPHLTMRKSRLSCISRVS
jgi:hypothetical protein